jgi:hypothetical protein
MTAPRSRANRACCAPGVRVERPSAPLKQAIGAIRVGERCSRKGRLPDMTRNSTFHPVVSIGNGLFAQVRQPETILEAYRRLQRACKQEKRDRNGTCYRRGHRVPEAA